MREKVIAYAIQVLGSKDLAITWLNSENMALDYKKPITLLSNDKECDKIITILSKIEEGIYFQ